MVLGKQGAVWLAAAIILCTGLSGCTIPHSQQTKPQANGDSANLAVPHWLPGFHWEYRTPDGAWRNFTIQETETYNHYSAYRVQVLLSKADALGSTKWTLWYDQASLGTLGGDEGSFHVERDPPAQQLFPMVSREYNSSIRTSIGFNSTQEQNYTVYGWESVATPAGQFDAVKVDTRDPQTNQTSGLQWYAPAALNVVAFQEDEGRFSLVSWGTSSTGQGA